MTCTSASPATLVEHFGHRPAPECPRDVGRQQQHTAGTRPDAAAGLRDHPLHQPRESFRGHEVGFFANQGMDAVPRFSSGTSAGAHNHAAVKPPSTLTCVPVTKLPALGETNSNNAPTNSSGSPNRRIGV